MRELQIFKGAEMKIKSTELVAIVNEFRKLEDEDRAELQHKTFMEKIRKELEVLNSLNINQQNILPVDYIDAKGEKRPCFELNRDGALQMLNSESAVVRYKTIEYINKLESQQPKMPTTYKEALLALVAAEEEKEKLQLEAVHKQEVIEGLIDNVSVTTKKDIINRVVKYKNNNYKNRYNELYKSFREIYHIDLKARCEGYNLKQTKKKDKLSTIKYADKMGYTDKLYEIACKLYESDVNEIKEFLKVVH